jgi:hypothetical protein
MNVKIMEKVYSSSLDLRLKQWLFQRTSNTHLVDFESRKHCHQSNNTIWSLDWCQMAQSLPWCMSLHNEFEHTNL